METSLEWQTDDTAFEEDEGKSEHGDETHAATEADEVDGDHLPPFFGAEKQNFPTLCCSFMQPKNNV